jgi:hypothetical protein
MNSWEPPRVVPRQRVHAGGVHVRRHPARREDGEDGFDESLFFLIALIAGAVCGYVVAIV